MPAPVITPLTPEEENLYSDNLVVLPGENKSYFDDTTIHIKFPIPNNNFQRILVEDVFMGGTLALLYVISDQSSRGAQSQTKNYMLSDEVPMSVFSITKEKLQQHNRLAVIVYNDHPLSFGTLDVNNIKNKVTQYGYNVVSALCDDKKSSEKEKKEKPMLLPKEACGGVIIRIQL